MFYRTISLVNRGLEQRITCSREQLSTTFSTIHIQWLTGVKLLNYLHTQLRNLGKEKWAFELLSMHSVGFSSNGHKSISHILSTHLYASISSDSSVNLSWSSKNSTCLLGSRCCQRARRLSMPILHKILVIRTILGHLHII